MCDNKPILVITSQEKLLCPADSEKDREKNPAELLSSAAKCNQQIIRAVKSLLKITTFTPQVSKKIKGGGVGSGKTWITNLRIDSDNRFLFSGYALDAKQVTQLGEEFLKSGSFIEVSLSNMNKNVFEKVPVWRFEITAKVN
ncbi:MAG: hypothetical protein PHX50_10205 [Massilibacteroides sp.]|nr:hypothetical protein [Massilibacteroides sp.]MDD3063189.1 hypothetical protein [Massilibacteroides sp.]